MLAPAALPPPSAFVLPAGFTIATVADLDHPRELAALPNGDLLVAGSGTTVWIIPHADDPAPAPPSIFASIDDAPDAGIAFAASLSTIFIGTKHGIYAVPYRTGDLAARVAPHLIAGVRRIPYVPIPSQYDHITTSLSFAGGRLYASVGATCNACVQTVPRHAVVMSMNPDGSDLRIEALHIRNAIAMTTDPFDGHVWVGDAGQDDLPLDHPYEFFDDLSSHPAPADYGWPLCEENRIAYTAGSDCSATVVPLTVFPAHLTPIGAVFYPAGDRRYEFPKEYQGDAFVTVHGSSSPIVQRCYGAPGIYAIPMRDGRPARPVDWSKPTSQLVPFVSGLEPSCLDASQRVARTTGIAVGADGSLFFADDLRGGIYRIRPQ